MKIPFGAKVRSQEGKEVGRVRQLVLHPGTMAIDGIVVHTGVFHQRDFVVPLSDATLYSDEICLTRLAECVGEYPLFDPRHFIRLTTIDWKLPATYDSHDLFLVGREAYLDAVLPLQTANADVNGTPRFIRDENDSPQDPHDLAIHPGTHVFDHLGQPVGVIGGAAINETSGSLESIVLKSGGLFSHTSVTLPASAIADVTLDGVTLAPETVWTETAAAAGN